MAVANILSDPRRRLLTDGGMETTLVYKVRRDLPAFAAFPLLFEKDGITWLKNYFRDYIEIAADRGTGFIFGAPTRRSNPAWVRQLGYGLNDIALASDLSVKLGSELRDEFRDRIPNFLISGCVGPRGDGYQSQNQMSQDEAADYHLFQIEALRDAGVDYITATAMSYASEAIGIARAACSANIPCVISFTLETDGKLPSGESLEEAIQSVDSAKGTNVVSFMINCAHPTHFLGILSRGGAWTKRIRGIRANASSLSHAELEAAENLDEGDPANLARQYQSLQSHIDLQIIGGCCGTDHRHVRKIAESCIPSSQ